MRRRVLASVVALLGTCGIVYGTYPQVVSDYIVPHLPWPYNYVIVNGEIDSGGLVPLSDGSGAFTLTDVAAAGDAVTSNGTSTAGDLPVFGDVTANLLVAGTDANGGCTALGAPRSCCTDDVAGTCQVKQSNGIIEALGIALIPYKTIGQTAGKVLEATQNGTSYVDWSAPPDLSATRNHIYMTNGNVAQASVSTTRCFPIDTPDAAMDIILMRMEESMVVSGIDCLAVGGTAQVTVNECDVAGANCVAIESVITCNTTDTTETGGIDNAAVDSGDWIRADVGTVSSATQVTVCISFNGGLLTTTTSTSSTTSTSVNTTSTSTSTSSSTTTSTSTTSTTILATDYTASCLVYATLDEATGNPRVNTGSGGAGMNLLEAGLTAGVANDTVSGHFVEGAAAVLFDAGDVDRLFVANADGGGTSGLDSPSFTAVGWVRPITSLATMRIFDKVSGNVGSRGVLLSDSRLRCEVGDGDTVTVVSTGTIADNAFGHIGCTFNDATNTITTYLGGEAEGTGTQDTNGDSTAAFTISTGAATNTFNGQVDEFCWSTSAWTAAQICRVCACGIDGTDCACGGDGTVYATTGRLTTTCNTTGCNDTGDLPLCNASAP